MMRAERFLNRHAGQLLLLGLGAAALYNWRLWQRDKALLAEKGTPEPLPPLETWPDLPTVSVLVAAWNEADNIERHIASFLNIRYPRKQLVLCAGGTDGTYELAARHAGGQVVILRQEPGEGKQQALARGFEHALGEIIFLTDADCLLADEPFERTLRPVAWGKELVATGSSQPFPHQLNNPFIFTQAAIQIYSAMRAPDHAPGILGRNCAVRSSLLADRSALSVPAPTGTDYVLAKTLAAAGVQIRQVPHSRVQSEYPSSARAYLRQQRRWLWNVIHHGCRFGARDEVFAGLISSLIGLSMLAVPLLGFCRPWILALWGSLYFQAWLSRLRYIAFAGPITKRNCGPVDAAWQGPILMLDFAAWARPLLDYVRRHGPGAW